MSNSGTRRDDSGTQQGATGTQQDDSETQQGDSGTQQGDNLRPEGVAGPSDRPQSLEWAQVDVFAEALHQGNQLAIFLDGRGLSDKDMQALARETNLSETTFVLPRSAADEQAHGIRVRIFTVEEELPFAGHPTLGTASWLRKHRTELHDAPEVKLALNVGTVVVRFAAEQTGPGLVGEMHQRDAVFGTMPSRDAVAAALGLTVERLHLTLQPQVVSTGLPFLIVPLRSVEASGQIAISTRELQGLLASAGAHYAYVIAPITSAPAVAGAEWHARMPLYGSEDPATGSAAGCAISYLVRYRAAVSGVDAVIEQGIEILRPSRLTVRATLKGDQVVDVWVAGRTIPVASGRFFLQ